MAGHYILANLSRHGLRHYLRFHFRWALSPVDACLTRRPAPKGSDARCAFPIMATTVRPTSVALRSTRPLSLLRQPISMLSDLPHYFECTHGPRIAKIPQSVPPLATRIGGSAGAATQRHCAEDYGYEQSSLCAPNLGHDRQSARSRQWQRMPSPARIHAARR